MSEVDAEAQEAYRKMIEERFKGPISIDLESVHGFNAYFSWSQEGIGFGQSSLSLQQKEDHVIINASTEGMSLEWIRRAMHTLVDAIMDKIPEDADRYSPVVKIPCSMEAIAERSA